MGWGGEGGSEGVIYDFILMEICVKEYYIYRKVCIRDFFFIKVVNILKNKYKGNL